jgi:hypothetical protein
MTTRALTALNTTATVIRQQYLNFSQIEQEVPGMPFGAAVRCMVTIQESGILNLVLSCKRLREDGRVVERVVGALKGRIAVTYNAAAVFVKKREVVGQPTLIQAKEVLRFIEDSSYGEVTRLTRCMLWEQDLSLALRLIEHGADVNAASLHGDTPLMMAANWDRVAIVRALLDARANLEHRPIQGWTVLLQAAASNHREVIELLLERKADVQARTNTGLTALQLTDRVDIKALLIKAGALPTSAKKPPDGS